MNLLPVIAVHLGMGNKSKLHINSEVINDVVSIRQDCVETINVFNDIIDQKLSSIEFFDNKIIRTVPLRDPSVILTFVKDEYGNVQMFADINADDQPPGMLSAE